MRLGFTKRDLLHGFIALLLTATGLGVGTAASAAAPPAVAAVGNFFQVVNRQTSGCLDVKSFSTADSVQLQRFACNTGTNQLWAPVLISGTSYTLINNHSGLCVDVRGGSVASGAEVQQFTCNATVAQAWLRTPIFIGGALWETLRNQASGFCLTATAANLIVQSPCGAGDSQLWRLQ